MAKKPATLETLAVAMELLRRIPRGRKITSEELHEELRALGIERDKRSVQRMLKSLSEYFDIERDDRTPPFGYQWKQQAPGFMLPAMSNQESLLLALAAQQLRPLLPPAVMKSMDGFFKQARTNLASHNNAELEKQWLKKVRVVNQTQPLLPPKIADNVMDQVSQALYNNYWLDLDYTNGQGERKQHRVMPLGLAQQGPRIYMVCRFEGYDNERSMALHRIHSAKNTGLLFERPKFDLAQYDEDGRFAVSEGLRINLCFRIRKGPGLHLLESPLSLDQQVIEHQDYYEIQATVVQSLLLERWLNSFGDKIFDIQKIVSRND